MKIREMFEYCGMDTIVSGPTSVTGGLMHSVYLVETKSHKYAVKHLNPVIMRRNGVCNRITNSENIGVMLSTIVSAVPAKIYNGEPIIRFDGDFYIIFDWLEGKSIFPPHITKDNCSKIGQTLGKIHMTRMDIPTLEKEDHNVAMYEWEKYLELGSEINATWLDELKLIIQSLKKWNKQLTEVSDVLNSELVISHRDLDPKNVMWKDGQPYLIDWEAAGYVNPYQELLEVLNYWADDGNGQFIKENFDALYNSYKNYNKCSNINWDDVIASGYSGMLGWLDYNLKRSLGIEAYTEEEKVLGTNQVRDTIKAFNHYEEKKVSLMDWLSCKC